MLNSSYGILKVSAYDPAKDDGSIGIVIIAVLLLAVVVTEIRDRYKKRFVRFLLQTKCALFDYLIEEIKFYRYVREHKNELKIQMRRIENIKRRDESKKRSAHMSMK